MTNRLVAGSGVADITPKTPQFLYGYPHVERISTGVHDPLQSSALYLDDGHTRLLFIANDVIFVSKALCWRVRRRIGDKTGIPEEQILISATHTHSGPVTVDYISNENDSVVPPADPDYLAFLENRMVKAALHAVRTCEPAVIGMGLADSSGIGGNRHAPDGAADPQVPVLLVRSLQRTKNIACLVVCSMHPTVLHEDSTLISADFPGAARTILQNRLLGDDCPVLHHTGPAGNQSPRHVTRGNTFAEADRLGAILVDSVMAALRKMTFIEYIELGCRTRLIDLPPKRFPTPKAALQAMEKAADRLQNLRLAKASPQEIRTAECDWFGSEETLTLARAAATNRLEAAYRSCLPAEIQIFQIGSWNLVAWPGEILTEYALALKQKAKNTFVVSLANGELQGYIATPEAAASGSYESANALFAPESGQILVKETLELLLNSPPK
ncbi:neutral/alkaline non-lysosomal ceramidase N-terminal domain-containing protein [candidate division KSB1 bacterium]|nr:neutral/alkaline non-lysosomal ceramidase N-terminal domain-containing protein [candidate division KSB1 bacterium]